MPTRPVNAWIAIGLALMPYPALKLLDLLNRGCGDGLCGFFSGLMILGGLAFVTLIFIIRSARAGETPSALRLLPPALWVLALAPAIV